MTFFTQFFAAVPWFLPGTALWAVGAVALSSRVARALRTSPAVTFLLLMSLGFVLLSTLTPTAAALAGDTDETMRCDLARVTFPTLSELQSITDTSRNIVLFVPMGIALGCLPASRRSLAVGCGAAVLPVLIELVQLAFPAFGRGCQSADVIDNLSGLFLGLGLAVACRAFTGALRRAAR
jgi:glycopeptide antibiotics resistance protein